MCILLLIFHPAEERKHDPDDVKPFHPNSYIWIGMPIEVNCERFIVWFHIYPSPHPWKFGEVEGLTGSKVVSY